MTESASEEAPHWRRVEHLRTHGQLHDARQLAEHTLSLDDLSFDEEINTMAQLMAVAGPVADLYPGATFTPLTSTTPIGWAITNPSIHPTAEEIHAYVRVVNYRSSHGKYVVHHPETVVMTRPRRIMFDAEFELRGFYDLIDSTGFAFAEHYHIRGFEDFRLFEHDGTEYAIASFLNASKDGIVQQYLLTLRGDRIKHAVPLSTFNEGHHKNWMPVVGHRDMLFVDSCSPKRIRKYDPETASATIEVDEPADRFCSRFRGGSQLVPWRDGYLAVIHEVTAYVNGSRDYLHRFVYFNQNLDITMCSDQFWFARRGIEFCAGLRHDGTSLIASFGVEDRLAWVVRLPEDEVWTSLTSIAGRTTDPAAVPSESTILWTHRSGIASTTLAHAGREEALAEALTSVIDHVDSCVVVNTDRSEAIDRVARQIAGDKLVLRYFDWTNNFSAARDASLAFAGETDAAWALIVDSDEQIQFGDVQLTSLLDDIEPDVHSLSTSAFGGSYTKVRVFRLPVVGRFVGVTHEYFDTRGKRQGYLNGVTFSERGKDANESQHKIDRDLEILYRETQRRPMDTRWWYYLGDALANQDRNHEAIEAFRNCANLEGWNEEAAWACYREAQCWLAIDQPDMAIARCTAGIALHPGVAELPWLAGYACWHAGRHRDAIAFSNLAIVHGEVYGLANETHRSSFRHYPALYEGPFDVLRFAYRALGETDAANQAERDFQDALTTRRQLPGQS